MAHRDQGRLITTWRRPIGEKGEKCVAHRDKGQIITTWRRPIGETGEKCVAHSSNTTGSSAARNLPSISRFVQRRQSTPGVLTVVKKSCFVLFVCV